MTTEQREAIKNIKSIKKSIRSDQAEESEDNQELANDLDTVLSLIEKYQAEIKSRDERITELEKDVISLNYRIEKLNNQNKIASEEHEKVFNEF